MKEILISIECLIESISNYELQTNPSATAMAKRIKGKIRNLKAIDTEIDLTQFLNPKMFSGNKNCKQ